MHQLDAETGFECRRHSDPVFRSGISRILGAKIAEGARCSDAVFASDCCQPTLTPSLNLSPRRAIGPWPLSRRTLTDRWPCGSDPALGPKTLGRQVSIRKPSLSPVTSSKIASSQRTTRAPLNSATSPKVSTKSSRLMSLRLSLIASLAVASRLVARALLR